MKKTLYIISFVILGLLVQFLVHAIIEVWYIGLLVSDFSKYGFGLSWKDWVLIHHIGSVILLAAGAFFGYRQGKLWWHKIYEEQSGVRTFIEKFSGKLSP